MQQPVGRHRNVVKKVVIDGSNVCRSYLCFSGESSLAPLLTLTCALRKRGIDFQCLFDANERYVLQRNAREPDSDRLYETLLREMGPWFQEVPGATDADSWVLALADRESLSVISNDRFANAEEQYQAQYPWLTTARNRLLKGGVEEALVLVPGLEISTPLNNDLRFLTDQLRQ